MPRRQREMIGERLGDLADAGGAATFNRVGYPAMKFGALRTQQAVIKRIAHQHVLELEIRRPGVSLHQVEPLHGKQPILDVAGADHCPRPIPTSLSSWGSNRRPITAAICSKLRSSGDSRSTRAVSKSSTLAGNAAAT